jgi:hypothetical protein
LAGEAVISGAIFGLGLPRSNDLSGCFVFASTLFLTLFPADGVFEK